MSTTNQETKQMKKLISALDNEDGEYMSDAKTESDDSVKELADDDETEREEDTEDTDDRSSDSTTENDYDSSGDNIEAEEESDDDKSSRRTVSCAGMRRKGRSTKDSKMETETDASSIVVTYSDDHESQLRVEQILCRLTLTIKNWIPMLKKMNSRYVKSGSRLQSDIWDTVEDLNDNVELYLVKWKNLSYIHCSWESEAKLLELEGPHMKQKLLRFFRLEPNLQFELTAYGADVYFNPDFVEIDRVLDVRIVPSNSSVNLQEETTGLDVLLNETEYGEQNGYVKEFLMKWRGLQYKDLSWEIFEDFQDTDAIVEYYEHLNRDVSTLTNSPYWRPPLTEYRKVSSDIIYKNDNVMRSYQVEGTNWMLWNWLNRRNSILADEMGLGKTVQSAMFMYSVMRDYKVTPPFLVVAPLSTLPHWESEIRRWTDMHVVVLHGSVESRESILKYEWKSKSGEFDVLLTTYEISIMESTLLSSITWAGIIVDEAHRLKGKNNKLGDTLRKLDCGCRLLLTGTPLQNNTEELWTLLSFLQPDRFSDMDAFQTDFGDMKNASQLEKLQEILKPFMLRRMKEDVEKSLKPKEETVINVELTALQKKFYRAVYDHNTSVFIGTDNKNLPSLMNIMMELRKCCNHPFLIRGAEQSIMAENNEKEPGQAPDHLVMQSMLNSSGKMVLLDKLLPKLQAQGHKVLLFSQMVRMLDIIQDYLAMKGYAFERIDGGVKINDRQSAIDRFSAPGSDRFIFLICTRAGGMGINLTAADTVIIYDSDWNPQNDIQAQARCHRIGQEKAVNVYRLITNRTYEMEMFQRANMKLGLDKAVLNPMKQTITADGQMEVNKLSKKEAETLLKYGAYDFFKEEREGKSDEVSNAFCEADIDQILEKNAKVITVDSQGSSSFSKASFVTNTSMEVDINDPNFWTKVVGLKSEENVDMGPRNRKKVEYGMPSDGGKEVEAEAEGIALVDEADWTKTDRDVLLKLLLSFGWGNWEGICSHDRMRKHPRSSVQVMALSIIMQCARGLKMVKDSDRDLRTGGTGGVRIASHSKEALESLRDSFEICNEVIEGADRAQAGDINAVGFPRSLPMLVRDTIWWQKLIKVTERHLKHLSFLHLLHTVMNSFHVAVGGIASLPTPRRAVQPTSWWSMQHDHDALVGVWRHGWGNWKEICLDADLCFAKEGVIFSNATAAADKEGDKDSDKEVETPSETPIASVPEEVGVKVFPTASLLMKRLRRLVSAMEIMVDRGTTDDLSLNVSCPTSPKRKERHGKVDTVTIDGWSQNELKNLRSAILRWGLPVPPTRLDIPRAGELKTKNGMDREVFGVENLPLTEEQMQMEVYLAVAAAVVSHCVQQTVLSVGDIYKDITSESISCEEMMCADMSQRAWLAPYPISHTGESSHLGLFSSYYGPYEFIRQQAKLKTKSVDMVQSMCRRIELRSMERYKQSKEVSVAGNDNIKKKEQEDTTDIVPSNVVGQRLYRRIQFYYEIQQYIWDKDDDTLRAVLIKWSVDGPRRQDKLSEGWDPLVHDIALLRGIRKFGFIEWDLLWSNPEMPFTRPEGEKKEKKKEEEKEKEKETKKEEEEKEKEKERKRKEEEEKAEALILSNKTMNRDIPGLSSSYAIRRLQSLLEMFRDYDGYTRIYTFTSPLSMEEETAVKGAVPLSTTERRVVARVGDEITELPCRLRVEESIHWKVVRTINRPMVGNRSEANRGDPSRAQLSADQIRYYEEWAASEHNIINGNPYNGTLTQEMRDIIHGRAALLVANTGLPMKVRSVTIDNLGSIPVNWSSYWCDKYIWPIGYCSSKSYFSYVDPNEHISYKNEIISGGPRGPIFRVTAEDDLNNPVQSHTATSCWTTILSKVRKERTRLGLGKTGTAVSGPEFFGFAMPEVAACIEGLEGAQLCKQYICRCLRMETNRKGKSHFSQGVSIQTLYEEPLEERRTKRKAAQLASQKWQGYDESESDDENDEDDIEDDEFDSDSEDPSSRARKSKKRSNPSSVTDSSAVSPKPDIGEDYKKIKTEELC